MTITQYRYNNNNVTKDRINEKQLLRSSEGSMTAVTVPESEELSMTSVDDEDQLHPSKTALSPIKVKGKKSEASALMHMVAEDLVSSFRGEEDDIGISERRLLMIKARIEAARKKTAASSIRKRRLSQMKESSQSGDSRKEALCSGDGQPKSSVDNNISSEPVSCDSSTVVSECSTNAVSIGEIRRYVMEQIPEEIKDQVPDDAWSAIFKDSPSIVSSSSTKVSKVDSVQTYRDAADQTLQLEKLLPEDGDAMIRLDENASVSSDLTGKTSEASKEKGEDENYDPRNEILKFLKAESQPETTESTKINVSARNANRSMVKFGMVEVRQYERVLSDTPCQLGPSIGIGWLYDEAQRISVEDWEKNRGDPRKPPQMLIPRCEREKILRELGYARKDLATSTRNNTRIRNQRRQTINNLNAQRMEEVIEMAKRKVKSIVRFGVRSGAVVIRKKRKNSTPGSTKQPSLASMQHPVAILKVSQ